MHLGQYFLLWIYFYCPIIMKIYPDSGKNFFSHQDKIISTSPYMNLIVLLMLLTCWPVEIQTFKVLKKAYFLLCNFIEIQQIPLSAPFLLYKWVRSTGTIFTPPFFLHQNSINHSRSQGMSCPWGINFQKGMVRKSYSVLYTCLPGPQLHYICVRQNLHSVFPFSLQGNILSAFLSP